MKKVIPYITYSFFLIFGLLLSIWAFVSWMGIGFRVERHPWPANTDGQFFIMSIFIGVTLVAYGYGSFKWRLNRDKASVAGQTLHKTRGKRNLVSHKDGLIFSNQSEAKNFFVDRVISQARKEGTPLSQAQKYMLNWTEAEEGFQIDERLNERFHAEITDEAYEKKIGLLLKHAYQEDVATDLEAREKYYGAYNALKNHDHYILIMVKDNLFV
jgi:hypothetical protein